MTDQDEASRPDPDAANTVLEVFGMKLAVKNRRLAEVLTRDAAEVFSRDKKLAETTPPDSSSLTREVVAEALPDVLLAPPSVRDGADDEVRAALKRRCDQVAESVGVRSTAAHLWSFDDGTSVHVRVIARVTTPASAAAVIPKLKTTVLAAESGPQSVLLVTPDSETSQAMRGAIDALDARCSFRVIDVASLERLGYLCAMCAHPSVLFAALVSPEASVAWPDLLAALEELRRS